MLEAAYVITWRFFDGSGSGAIAAFTDKGRADALLKILEEQGSGKAYKVELVAFDSAHGVGTPDGGQSNG